MSILSDKQLVAWQKGTCIDAYKTLGAHPSENGVVFRVWAPNAQNVDVVGDFNDWNDRAHPMEKDASTGIWETEVSSAKVNDCYKFKITPAKGASFLKADPCGFYNENNLHHASVVYSLADFKWSDSEWLEQRHSFHQPDQPLSIYEVHAGSWQRKPSGEVLSYGELADKLIPYVKKMGFTHIELMPVMEHPYNPSWGYQVTGYYAPTSRYGTPDKFMAFVDACHQNNIGVILDWVPGHFPKDAYALAYFDGTPLFEHEDERRREHADWGTHNFDFEKPEVRNFLISNAFFWCEKYHIDGFRVDAVASMLYLDYSKSDGEWLPNEYGGNENLGAITFMRDMNELLGRHHPSFLTIAEESTAWAGVTQEVSHGGLGFNYKWNMGWMNDTLHYFEQSPDNRIQDNHYITFPITFAFSEQFILPFSHDEVVHLKKSLWSKMPGSSDQKYAQLKLLFLYMIAYPGKKLLFMGNELAETEEWSESRALNWSLLEGKKNKEVQEFLTYLLHFYRSEPALYQSDHTENGFEWKDISEQEKGVFAFLRRGENNQELIFVLNFSTQSIADYSIREFNNGSFKLLFDTFTNQEETSAQKEWSGSFPLEALQGMVLRRKS